MDRSLLFLLLSCCCLSPVVRAGCLYRDQTKGLEVNLTAINHYIGSAQPINGGSSTTYYLDLCQPLNLTGNCSVSSNTTVCAVSNSSGDLQYTSYGRLVGVVYSLQPPPLQAATPNVSVNLTFSHGDPTGSTPRQTEVRLTCNVPGLSNVTVSVDSDDNERLVVTIATGLQCVFTTSTATTSSSSVPAPPTVTSQPSPTPSIVTSLPSPTHMTPSTKSTAMLKSSSTTLQPRSSSHSLSPESVPTSHPTTLPRPSYPVSTPFLNFTSVPAVPTNPPSCHESSEDCSETLALALGISIPATAILTFLTTFIVIFCCFKVKKKRSYIHLAPTVYFDEEDEQD